MDDNLLQRVLSSIRLLTPIFAVAIVVALAMSAILAWSTYEIDESASDRQKRLINLIVSQTEMSLAHDQESSTVWDDAVLNVRAGSTRWIDQNMGAWMHTYFGHDGAVVLDPRNVPIYAFFDEANVDPKSYQRLASEVDPLVEKLRSVLVSGETPGTSDRVLTPGASDMAIILGRPAVVSVKPIVSDTGAITQNPGEEYLHVAFRYLDGSLIDRLRDRYQFDHIRFDWLGRGSSDESVYPLKSSDGRVLGSYLWRPFRPGMTFLGTLLPLLAAGFLISVLVISTMVLRLKRRSLSLKETEAANKHQALHDALTGLPNRSLFMVRRDAALTQPKPRVAVLYLDLDRFKQVNDALGHTGGDELIRQFCIRAVNELKPSHTLARLGGDEFVILIPDFENDREVDDISIRLVEAARAPFEVFGNQVLVGLSIGIATSLDGTTAGDEMTRRSDVALYYAKSTGRSRHARYTPAMDSELRKRRLLEQELRNAVNGSAGAQIEIFYQPLYAAQTLALVGFEALLRWDNPMLGAISPNVFIQVAEEIGLMEKLGQKVMREACAAAQRWQGLTVAVNVSALELRNPNFAIRVAEILLDTGLLPQRLELEITESALTENLPACVDNITALRKMGVRVALDDFGTGFSSLNRLQELTVDRIKIDRTFVQGFGQGGSAEAIVKAIVDLANATGLEVTAEGVENHDQVRILTNFGCSVFQGFLFSKPVTLAEANAIVRHRSSTLARVRTASS